MSRAELIWAGMVVAYGGKWTREHTDDPKSPDGIAWSAELRDLNREQIERGLETCRKSPDEWPPSIGQFRAMCLGIPPFATVKRETLRPHDERSKFTRAVWARVDHYQHRIASVRDGDRMLLEAYEQVRDAVMRGEPLPDIVGVLAHEPSAKATGLPPHAQRPEHLRNLLAKLGEEYNPATADPNYDPHKAHRDEARTTLEAEIELRRQLYSATSSEE